MGLEQLAQSLSTLTWFTPLIAFLWGIASVMLSPCHVTSVPLLVTFLAQSKERTHSAWTLSFYCTLGMSLSLLIVAGITIAAGRIIGDLWGLGPWFTAVLLTLAALHLLGVLDLPSWGQLQQRNVRKTRAGACIAGTLLGLTLGPCTFAFVAPVLVLVTHKTAGFISWLSFVAFSIAHVGCTYLIGGVGVRMGQWLKSGTQWTTHIKRMAGLAALALAAYTIIHIP